MLYHKSDVLGHIIVRTIHKLDYSNHLNTEHLKSEHLTFQTLFVRFSNDLII